MPENYNVNVLYDTLEELIRAGYDEFLCGMARGFDLLALDCLVALKQKYRIRLVACIPYRGNEEGFSARERTRYLNLLGWCDEKYYCFERYFEGCFLARDRYMVDRAELLLAYCTKKTGGAAYTVKYAEKKGITVKYVRL